MDALRTRRLNRLDRVGERSLCPVAQLVLSEHRARGGEIGARVRARVVAVPALRRGGSRRGMPVMGTLPYCSRSPAVNAS